MERLNSKSLLMAYYVRICAMVYRMKHRESLCRERQVRLLVIPWPEAPEV